MTARTLKSRNLLLKIHGELRHGMGVARFRALIDRALAGGQGPDIVLDLEALESVDSSGIGELVFALRRVSAAGGRLTLLRPPGKVRRFLAVTGLSSLFGLPAETPERRRQA